MTSAPDVALVRDTAERSEPAPLSFALVTVKMAGARRSSRYSSRGRQKRFGRRPRFGGRAPRAFHFTRAANSRHQERDMVRPRENNKWISESQTPNAPLAAQRGT